MSPGFGITRPEYCTGFGRKPADIDVAGFTHIYWAFVRVSWQPVQQKRAVKLMMMPVTVLIHIWT